MKALLGAFGFATLSLAAFGQGKVGFANDSNHYYVLGQTLPADSALGGGHSSTNGNTSSGTVGAIPTSPLPSGVYLAEALYAGYDSNNLFLRTSLVMSGVNWLAPGRPQSKAVTLTNMPGGQPAYFRIDVFDAAYSNAPSAAAAGSYAGSSGLFTATPGSSITFPGLVSGTAAFSTWYPANLVINAGPPNTNPPSITGQPQDVTVHAFQNAQFTVTVDAPQTVLYQWTFNGSNIAGATSSSLTVSNVTPPNLGTYAVLVTNYFSSVTSSNVLLSMYPFLATNFTGAVTYWGKDASFSAVAWGDRAIELSMV